MTELPKAKPKSKKTDDLYEKEVIVNGDETYEITREIRKQMILETLVPLSETEIHHTSKWKSLSNDEDIGSISALQHANFVSIEIAGEDFEKNFMKMRLSYDLLNSDGKRILFACETTNDPVDIVDDSRCLKKRPDFNVVVIGAHWDYTFNIICNHRQTTVTTEAEYIGQIFSTTLIKCRCFKPDSYKVKNSKGKTTHLIKYMINSSVNGFPPCYFILDKTTKAVVGKIKNTTRPNGISPGKVKKKCYGISLDHSIPLRTRLLLIGAFFTIIGTKGFLSLTRVLRENMESEEKPVLETQKQD